MNSKNYKISIAKVDKALLATDKSLGRRDFLKTLGFVTAASLVSCSSTSNDKATIKVIKSKMLYKAPTPGEFTITVEGSIPSNLEGVLYRNGPSLFERGGVKKNHLLDGEGFITRLEISGGVAKLKGDYVKTDKFIAEDKAGKWLYDSFTTIISDNDKQSILTQDNDANKSSVSVRYIDGKLYSFEESLPPYEIGLDDLSAKKATGFFQQMPVHSAHGKHDKSNGDFINFGIQFGDPDPKQRGKVKALYSYLHVYVHNQGRPKMYRKIQLSGIIDKLHGVYMHDFFFTKNYIIFNVQPLIADLTKIYPANQGFGKQESSLGGSFTWDANKNNKLLIISRLNPKAEPLVIDTPSTEAFWHSINAYETSQNQISVEFIGYKTFNFFSHQDPLSRAIQEGQINLDDSNNAHYNGVPVRYEINLQHYSNEAQFFTKGNMQKTVIAQSHYGEFPMINPLYAGVKNKYFYQGLVPSNRNGLVNGLGRFNNKSNELEQSYFLPEDHIVGEPVFCNTTNGSTEDDGYLIATAHNLTKEQSYIVIFDAKTIKTGPVAKLKLNNSLPYRLHGEWVVKSS